MTTTAYDIDTLKHDADEGTVVVSVLYAEHLDSDTAPAWRESDDAAVAAHLAATYGGTWRRAGEWDAGDHPKRLEAVCRWQREAV